MLSEWLNLTAFLGNKAVVGAAPTGDHPTTTEWSTSLLPTKVWLILGVWQYHLLLFKIRNPHKMLHPGIVQYTGNTALFQNNIYVNMWFQNWHYGGILLKHFLITPIHKTSLEWMREKLNYAEVAVRYEFLLCCNWSRSIWWFADGMIPGPRLNIKTVLSTYGDFHVKDKTS